MIDQELITRLRQKDEQAFSDLLDRYGGYVAAIISNLSRGALSTEDIEELSADVFLAVWNSAQRLRDGSPLKPYLARIARNSTFSRLRRPGCPPVPYDDELDTVTLRQNPDQLAEQREQTEILNEAVQSFGEPDRELFIRYYFFGERLCAAAERLRLNQATAKTKLRRCRERLLAIFQERGYGNEENQD